MGIKSSFVMLTHYILLLGFPGIIMLFRKGFSKYFLPVALMAYFNIVHCYYMAFDRYAFPLLPVLSLFSAYFILEIVRVLMQKET